MKKIKRKRKSYIIIKTKLIKDSKTHRINGRKKSPRFRFDILSPYDIFPEKSTRWLGTYPSKAAAERAFRKDIAKKGHRREEYKPYRTGNGRTK